MDRWWLAGQLWVAKTQIYPKPSLSVSPSVVVAVGGNVNISCKSGHYPQAEFHLFQGSARKSSAIKTSQAYGALFSIMGIQPSDYGIYSCAYSFKSNYRQRWSASSEEVIVYVREQSLSKPFISVIPSQVVALGGNVSIQCKSKQYHTTGFNLIKEGALQVKKAAQHMRKVEGDEAVFPMDKTKRSDGGIYWCEYSMGGYEGLMYSLFSDRVYINITDASLKKPAIKMSSRKRISPGRNVTIKCQGPEDGLTFSLHKSRGLIASQMAEPNRNTAAFFLFMTRPEDTENYAENYTCQYHLRGNPFVWSEPSKPVELVVVREVPMKIIIWASCASGLLLVLLLLLLAFVLYRKRKRNSTASERNQPENMPMDCSTSGEKPQEPSFSLAADFHCV
ncbi:immunoglobulin superfamily member 1-like isoform X2 [Hemicordylus capensis]|uniref:immunoglobulin superfamily member 1-like isoform X2 n=1 Tax=Hemicordylus capensis TaxID=884348 RepID=UPI002302E916|nr:immunoglobulin superfamily member 1-like isoform X2 [Hemicordylus capensis]